MVHKLEELPVFSKAREFSDAVSETLRRSSLRRNSNLYDQIEQANDSILSNMDEGFEQSTDDGFAKYLVYSKGSIAEVMRRLRRAADKHAVRSVDLPPLEAMAEPLEKMIGGFIKYLRNSGFTDRGAGTANARRQSKDSECKDSGCEDSGCEDSGCEDS